MRNRANPSRLLSEIGLSLSVSRGSEFSVKHEARNCRLALMGPASLVKSGCWIVAFGLLPSCCQRMTDDSIHCSINNAINAHPIGRHHPRLQLCNLMLSIGNNKH
jgi:hypothetical protein